jgi:preprotein translocase subunit SecE
MSGGIASGSTMDKTNPMKFAQEVRQEAAKVTWPTRKETLVTTGMVFVMVVLAAAFFFVADQILSFGVRLIMGSGA